LEGIDGSFICRVAAYLNKDNSAIDRGVPKFLLPAMYDKNFKPNIFTDITMLRKLFAAQSNFINYEL